MVSQHLQVKEHSIQIGINIPFGIHYICPEIPLHHSSFTLYALVKVSGKTAIQLPFPIGKLPYCEEHLPCVIDNLINENRK